MRKEAYRQYMQKIAKPNFWNTNSDLRNSLIGAGIGGVGGGVLNWMRGKGFGEGALGGAVVGGLGGAGYNTIKPHLQPYYDKYVSPYWEAFKKLPDTMNQVENTTGEVQQRLNQLNDLSNRGEQALGYGGKALGYGGKVLDHFAGGAHPIYGSMKGMQRVRGAVGDAADWYYNRQESQAGQPMSQEQRNQHNQEVSDLHQRNLDTGRTVRPLNPQQVEPGNPDMATVNDPGVTAFQDRKLQDQIAKGLTPVSMQQEAARLRQRLGMSTDPGLTEGILVRLQALERALSK